MDEGYVVVRPEAQRPGFQRMWIGRADEADVADRAIAKWHQLKDQQRLNTLGIDQAKRRMLLEDGADIFLKLHGQKAREQEGH